LEGVFNVLFAVQDVAAYSPDQSAVPPHQRREGFPIPAGNKLLQ
jgi:hypothetical protein